MELQELLDELKQRGVRLERDGEKLRITAPKGALTPELISRISISKNELLSELDRAAAEKPRWLGHQIPPGAKWISEAAWKARVINEIFDKLGTSKWPSRITEATVRHGLEMERNPRPRRVMPKAVSSVKKSDISDISTGTA
jgi:hypothetical protein